LKLIADKTTFPKTPLNDETVETAGCEFCEEKHGTLFIPDFLKA